jgi:hypothetical protein
MIIEDKYWCTIYCTHYGLSILFDVYIKTFNLNIYFSIAKMSHFLLFTGFIYLVISDTNIVDDKQ